MERAHGIGVFQGAAEPVRVEDGELIVQVQGHIMLLQSGQPMRVQFPVGDHVTARAATHGRIRVGAHHMGDVAPMAPHDRLFHHAHHVLHLRIGELAGAHVHGGRLRCVGQWGDGWQLVFVDHLPVGAGAAQGVESGVQFVGCVAVLVGQMAGEVMALPIGQHGGGHGPAGDAFMPCTAAGQAVGVV